MRVLRWWPGLTVLSLITLPVCIYLGRAHSVMSPLPRYHADGPWPLWLSLVALAIYLLSTHLLAPWHTVRAFRVQAIVAKLSIWIGFILAAWIILPFSLLVGIQIGRMIE